MSNLPIILFLLGIVFLFLGWRWQNPPNEEAMTALKGLAYLKREIIQVQDQVHILEDKIQTVEKNESKNAAHREIEHKEIEHRGIECNEKSQLYELKTKEQTEGTSGSERKRNISPKYQEVIELAAKGHRIPEIAQQLLLSQDAVMMVLQTQSKGAAK
ncbi:DNA-binding response regulator [Desulfosporosinus fructosivorans]|uniref:DNA-binding response regulator n=1 Tax=Desulfosporosinus fructosivorans TaxID=2018669 RepID=A0A4Z0R1H2_9FIRM|nr:DNA-binding response regulator [Desulfosporosinus fructosivorans]TGE35837.1 DNA-binding response regulator [Desulfosporosinus fructosivorans]